MRPLVAAALLLALPAFAQTSLDWSLAHMMESPLGFPRERESSGTAWQPDDTPMLAVHVMPGHGWMLMIHWALFAGFDDQLGPRGGSRWASTNWVMAMLDHSLAGGRLELRTMLSAEPLTAGGAGVPLLGQTGETWQGRPLHDLQHPHDLFMEVAALYERALTRDLGFELYAAPSGEPALGPPAFMHRYSASADPLPPLGHHWMDSTHVSFGVLTGGLYTRVFKLEASWFNGREPDENRYNFDFNTFDSWSVRAQVAPVSWLSAQVSYGALRQPEATEPGNHVQRITASVMTQLPVAEVGTWGTTLIWGHNIGSLELPTSALLLESAMTWNGRDTVFGRLEWVQKSGQDLVLPAAFDDDRLPIRELTLGYVHDFDPLGPLVLGLGGRVAVTDVGQALASVYGGALPLGGMIFLRLHAPPMPMGHSMHVHHES